MNVAGRFYAEDFVLEGNGIFALSRRLRRRSRIAFGPSNTLPGSLVNTRRRSESGLNDTKRKGNHKKENNNRKTR